jgi:ATP-dependent helicase HrpB
MAQETGTALGDLVGFQTRFESQHGPRTRIMCLTEGLLQRRLLDDPFLNGVACVLFDEFHERNLASDLALAMCRQVQQAVRPELKLVVMSATLDPAPIAAWLGGCPTVVSQGRAFPVAVEYLPELSRRPLEQLVATGVALLLERTAGDLLVFLPGVGEIRKAAVALQSLCAEQGVVLAELYGDLPAAKQDAVLQRGSQRKVILATNVAETSLTIEGITGVVDSGLARTLRYDARTGLDQLELLPISQASADQRAGRAGRTQPGVCLRLWPEAAQRARAERETPEVHRVELSSALLQVACWIEPEVASFPWFEPPRAPSLESAQRLLERLGALADGLITPMGRELARWPASPRVARMLWEGGRLGQAETVALAAALLAERSPWLRSSRGPGRHTPAHQSSSDVLDRVAALQAFELRGERYSELGELNPAAAKTIFRARDQLLRHVKRLGPAVQQPHAAEEALLRALLAGYPDRLARRRELGSRRGVLTGGRGVVLAPESAVAGAELYVCIEVDGGASDVLVRQASLVQREWLSADQVRQGVELCFDAERQQVVARRRVWCDDLLLEESPTSLPPGNAVAALLAAEAAQAWEQVFPHDQPALQNWLERVAFTRHHLPDANLPSCDLAALVQLLPELCQGRRSFAELRAAPWLEHVRGLLSWQQQQVVERAAPEKLTVPSGSQIRLEYQGHEPPVLAVRIQELFGLAKTPTVAEGRVPVLLHLLGPNYRPQQITPDLASFWKNTYPLVRKELRARYPKHSWPEDPCSAPPQRKPGRRPE